MPWTIRRRCLDSAGVSVLHAVRRIDLNADLGEECGDDVGGWRGVAARGCRWGRRVGGVESLDSRRASVDGGHTTRACAGGVALGRAAGHDHADPVGQPCGGADVAR